jgi:hypothetical protein
MKKLVAVFCSVLYMHSMGQSQVDVRITATKTSGEKVLVKALAAIVNREGKKRTPLKRMYISPSEYPWL